MWQIGWVLVALGLASPALWWPGLGRAQATIDLVLLDFPPYVIAGDKARPGIIVELMQEAAGEAGIALSMTVVPYARLIQRVESEPGLLGFPIGRDRAREARFLWVANLLDLSMGFLAPADRAAGPITSFDQARDLPAVLAWRGTAYEKRLKDLGFSNVLAGEGESLLRQLAAGRAAAWFTDIHVGLWRWRHFGATTPLVIGPALETIKVYVAAAAGSDPRLAHAFGERLKARIAAGALDRLFRGYGIERDLTLARTASPAR